LFRQASLLLCMPRVHTLEHPVHPARVLSCMPRVYTLRRGHSISLSTLAGSFHVCRASTPCDAGTRTPPPPWPAPFMYAARQHLATRALECPVHRARLPRAGSFHVCRASTLHYPGRRGSCVRSRTLISSNKVNCIWVPLIFILCESGPCLDRPVNCYISIS